MKNIIKVATAIFVVAVSSFAVYSATCDVELSALQNENLEAVARQQKTSVDEGIATGSRPRFVYEVNDCPGANGDCTAL